MRPPFPVNHGLNELQLSIYIKKNSCFDLWPKLANNAKDRDYLCIGRSYFSLLILPKITCSLQIIWIFYWVLTTLRTVCWFQPPERGTLRRIYHVPWTHKSFQGNLIMGGPVRYTIHQWQCLMSKGIEISRRVKLETVKNHIIQPPL